MRCTRCLSYIPEGLPEPIICPQCGKPSVATPPTPLSWKEPSLARAVPSKADTSAPPTSPAPPSDGFAPYFTIRARLWFGLPRQSVSASSGTISFGAAGFSVVSDGGQLWAKIDYSDLSEARLTDDAVLLSVRGIESRLVFFSSWPEWLARGARKRRALIFLELLGRVKNGLSHFEIETYRRRLS